MNLEDVLVNGEFTGNGTGEIFSIEELKRALLHEYLTAEAHKKERQLEGLKYQQNKTATQEAIQGLMGGDFIQQQYNHTIEVCLSDSGVYDSAFAFRLTYLCSFMNYDNILVFNNKKRSDSKYINEKDLLEVMGLDRKQLRQFKNLCFDAGILERVNIEGIEGLKINKLVACKGKLPPYYKRHSIRVSVPHIQDIYSRATKREHKQLGYLTALLPYVHYEYCLICHNPAVEYKKYIQPLTLQDICVILNYDKTKASRLLNELRKTTLNGEYVFMCAYVGEMETFFLNPKVYFKSSTPEGLKWLEELFSLSKDWEQNTKQRRRKKEQVKSLKEMVEEAKREQK